MEPDLLYIIPTRQQVPVIPVVLPVIKVVSSFFILSYILYIEIADIGFTYNLKYMRKIKILLISIFLRLGDICEV